MGSYSQTSQVAEMLGLGRSKTYQLLANGVLPSVRIGGSLRVPVEALQNGSRRSNRQKATAIPRTAATDEGSL